MSKSSLLPPTWQIPQVFHERLGETAGRQRCIKEDNQLLIVLHRPPEPAQIERQARLFWQDEEGNWHDSEGENGLNGLASHLREFENTIRQIEELEDQASISREYFGVLSQLSPLTRTARNCHVVMQEARTLTDDKRILELRDRSYQIARTAELLYEEARTDLDFIVAQRAEQQAESSHRMAVAAHRLNMLVAFFFPFATLSAVYGVNMTHGLETINAPWTFYIFNGVGFLLGLILISIVGKPIKAEK